MITRCGLTNCDNLRTPKEPGAEIGYTINNLNRKVLVCQPCAFKIMTAPRGTWEITKHGALRPLPAKPIIIT